jgi:hypothetical protein
MDTQGQPIPGANVVVKGTTIGTITDMAGNFSIALPSGVNTLMFSSIGYTSQEIPVRNTSMTVIMQEDVTSLDEVVVTGYAADYERRPR